MFSSRSLVPARRATLAALQTSLAEYQPLVFHLHQRQSQSQRRYAMRSPRVSRASRRAPEGRLLFPPSAIPPVSLWQEYLVNQRLGDLTPEDALRTARHYCDVATKDGSAWKTALERGMPDTPTRPLLHGPETKTRQISASILTPFTTQPSRLYTWARGSRGIWADICS